MKREVFRSVSKIGVIALMSCVGGALSLEARAGATGSAATIGRTFPESVPASQQRAGARADAPNVLIWVIDDLGYGQLGSFGGEIRTPTIDALSRSGLRYTNYHTTPICSASRAALLTGRNSHTVHIGGHSAMAIGFPGQDGLVPRAAGTIANNLHQAGYLTYAIGKWDHMPPEDASPAGPFTYWPSGQGFDRFYGFLSFDNDNFEPTLWSDNQPLQLPLDKDYHLSADMADRAIQWVDMRDAGPQRKPFLMYWATGATHAPHHAPDKYLQAYRGKFDEGWDVMRERVLQRQKALGVVPKDTQLPSRPEGMAPWSDLTADQRKLASRAMEAFAAQLTHADEQFGRVLDVLKKRGELDNTIVIVLADNGASAEGGPEGQYSEHLMSNGIMPSNAENMKFYDLWGRRGTYPHYPFGWAVAGNTPFRYYKQTAYEGGVRVPLIVSWPAGIKTKGQVRNQFVHVSDLMPTILQMAEVAPAKTVNGEPQMSFDGISMAQTIDQPEGQSPRRTQYFEMYGNRAIWHDGWKAVMPHRLKAWDFMTPPTITDEGWELYRLDSDVNERNNLAASQPKQLAELLRLFDAEARRFNVYPLTNTGEAQRVRLAMKQAELARRNGKWTYLEPVSHVPEANAPPLHTHSWRLDADVDVVSGAHGTIVARGGRYGGYALHVRDDVPEFVARNLDLSLFTLAAKEKLPPGTARLSVDFQRVADGADIKLYVDEREVAAGRLRAKMPVWILSNSDGFDVGSDSGSTVVPDAPLHDVFSGTIRRVDVTVRQ